MCADRSIDAAGQAVKIEIHGADEDPGVRGFLVVEPDEVSSIEGDHSASVCGGELQHSQIGERVAGLAMIGECQDIVPKAPQHLDDRPRHVLIG
jgi:hypothetical protein